MNRVKVHTSYVICATPRSGSTLLCEALRNTGLAGAPREYVNFRWQPVHAKRWGVTSDDQFIARMLRHAATPNGVSGVKITYPDAVRLEKVARAAQHDEESTQAEVLRAAMPNLHYIWLRRGDTARQAISYWTAMHTGDWSWAWGEHNGKEVPLKAEVLYTWEARLAQQDEVWASWFEEQGVTPHTLVYEEFIQNYAESVVVILEYLGIPNARELHIPVPRLKKQAGSRSEELLARYLEARKDLPPPDLRALTLPHTHTENGGIVLLEPEPEAAQA